MDEIFTNSQTNLLQYADDSKFYRGISNYGDMFELQERINQVSKWCTENKVTINPSKSYTMSVATRFTKKIETFYYINGQRIKRVEKNKDLGVMFDEDWKFETQYKEVQRKSNMLGHFGNRLSRKTGSRFTNMKVFQVYTVPIIDYCCPIWNMNEARHLLHIETIMRNITRITLRSPLLFNTSGIPEKSTVGRVMSTMSDHRTHIDFTIASHTQRERLKQAFINYRQTIALH